MLLANKLRLSPVIYLFLKYCNVLLAGTGCDVQSDEGVLVPQCCSQTDSSQNKENSGQPGRLRGPKNVNLVFHLNCKYLLFFKELLGSKLEIFKHVQINLKSNVLCETTYKRYYLLKAVVLSQLIVLYIYNNYYYMWLL